MPYRTRAELLDFLCLIFSLKPKPHQGEGSPESIAVAAGATRYRVYRLIDMGVIYSHRIEGEPVFDAEDIRIAAVAERFTELGATEDDLLELFAVVDAHCDVCSGKECLSQCRPTQTVRSILARLKQEANCANEHGKTRRAVQIGHVINSIDLVGDLV